MFASIAHRYDLLNTLLSARADAYWRRETAAAATVPADALVLDLCTGTGKLAKELCRRFPEAQIVGLDFCTQMLSVARQRYTSSFSLVSGDALSLPFKDSSCDLVTVAFGIRNFADLKAGLAEIHRCLKPGGVGLFLEFFLPQKGTLSPLYRFYLGRVLPFLGQTISRASGAYSYLRDSVTHFVSPGDLSQLMREAGFESVSHRPLTGGIVAIHQGRRGG